MGKYKNIIFLVETPILERYIERYGINTLRDMGYYTTILDLSPAILPVAYRNVVQGLCDYEKNDFYRCFTIEQFKENLSRFDPENTLLICSMGYIWDYRKIFRYITRKKYHFCYFMQELSATDSTKVSSGNQAAGLKVFLKKIVNHIPWQMQGIRGADFILGCGDSPEAIYFFKKVRLCGNKCPVVFFHSSNYEECLLNKDKERIIRDKYCVFVDQFLPYHSDLIAKGIKIDPKQYYSRLNALFAVIEKEYNIKVVVAAHPKADYKLHSECFPNNSVYYNQTCRLIKDSEFVIYHFSDSLSYVAVYKKPVLVAADQEVLAFFRGQIDRTCELMGCRYLDLESFSKEDIEERLYVNKQVYDEYVRAYLKGNYNGILEGSPLWRQIGEYIGTLK